MTAGPVAEVIARVESELAGFWASPDNTRSSPIAKTRASTMNFVGVGTHAEVDRLRAQTEELVETHAGRTLLISIDGRLAPWDVKADWSATCRRDGEVPICYDRVELSFGIAAAERVASVVSALTISDVQTIVEVAQGASTVLGDALAPICDRLIVDSSEVPIARIAEMARRTKAPLADRAFVRMFSWRDLTARFFDDAPEASRAIRRVEITQSPGEQPEPSAIFLGWMGSRLGWTFEARLAVEPGASGSKPGAAFVGRARDKAGAPIDISIVNGAEAEGDADPRGHGRRIDAVRIATSLRKDPLTLSCARVKASPSTVRWSMEGARTAEYLHPLGYRDETWVLTKTIDAMEGDRLLRESVLAAAAWSAL